MANTNRRDTFRVVIIMTQKTRVLIAKPGLDGHEVGAKLVARALRDAGMEVIYLGMRQTPASIVSAAIEEDVDVIGISILSGAHKELCLRIINGLKEKNADDIMILVGGIIPKRDIPVLNDMGIKGVFGPGTSTRKIISFINENIK
jgi:methylmalonyl-CoA mutase C-terminal domain/subunit